MTEDTKLRLQAELDTVNHSTDQFLQRACLECGQSFRDDFIDCPCGTPDTFEPLSLSYTFGLRDGRFVFEGVSMLVSAGGPDITVHFNAYSGTRLTGNWWGETLTIPGKADHEEILEYYFSRLPIREQDQLRIRVESAL